MTFGMPIPDILISLSHGSRKPSIKAGYDLPQLAGQKEENYADFSSNQQNAHALCCPEQDWL